MKNLIMFLLYLLASTGLLSAQNMNVSGTVYDEQGNTIFGATIIVKENTAIGTATSPAGQFSLNVPVSVKTLIVKHIGMEEQEVAVAPTVIVHLKTLQTEIDEIIVVAYGTSKKSSFTGSAEMIKTDVIEKRSVSNLTKALEGVVARLQSTSGGGQPGSGANLMIRGIGSINASSNPLYVLDGAPYSGDLSALNPNDIESVSVLKDASSATLFGARGANGVVMITSKKAKAGKTSVNLKASWGIISRAIPDYETVSTAQFIELAWESVRNQYLYGRNPQTLDVAEANASANYMNVFGGENYNPYNMASSQLIDLQTGKINPNAKLKYSDNWLKEPKNDHPILQEYQLSITGGSDKSRYLLSLGYLDENGLLKNSSFERFSGRLNIDSEFSDFLKGGMNTTFSYSKQQSLYGEDSAYSNVWYTALNMAPIYPVYIRDAEGKYVLDSNGNKQFDYGENRPYAGNFNTIATLYDDKQTEQADNLSTHLIVELGDQKNGKIGFLKDFKLQLNLNADYRNVNEMLYWNPEFGNAKNTNGLLSRENTRRLAYTFNQLLYYQKQIDQHNIDVLAGHEFYSEKYSYLEGARTGFPFPELYELGAGAVVSGADSDTDRYYVESYLSRLNYDYSGKYYFSASLRKDASSRFHESNRWATFWSLGGAWRMSEEEFIADIETVDNLTLKAAYGLQGNDYLRERDVDGNYIPVYYAWQGVYNLTYPNASNSGALVGTLENRTIGWEKSYNFNIGFEGRFFKNKLWGTVEYFHRKTSDLLLEIPMALSTGFSFRWGNLGEIVNKGVDLTIGANLIRQQSFSWDITLVGTHFTNEVSKLDYDGQQIISGSRITTVGQPVNSWYLPKSAGVDPLTGKQLYWYENEEKEMEITDSYEKGSASRFICGSRIPDFYGSLTNSFTIGHFDISFLTTFSIGGKECDTVYATLMAMRDPGNNWHKDMLNRWQKPGDITDVPRLLIGNVDAITDKYLIDASYFAFKNVTLRYSLPTSWLKNMKLSQVRFFATGDNLYTFTRLKGMDPQNSFSGGQSYSYAPVRNISLGVDIKF